jgi:hypothetical protein
MMHSPVLSKYVRMFLFPSMNVSVGEFQMLVFDQQCLFNKEYDQITGVYDHLQTRAKPQNIGAHAQLSTGQ